MCVNPFTVEGLYYTNPNSNFVFPEKKVVGNLFSKFEHNDTKNLVVPTRKTRLP